jgi:transglutaminase-like putative cysteine protease
MALDRWFRLSAYLTLGLSCVALVFAEGLFLPGLQVCLGPVLALLLASWWVEGRWSLPTWGANMLGLLIAGGGMCWLAMQLVEEDSLISRVPLHLALVPYMGPLVMAALLVKVFRPRMPGDFWRLQGLGLMQIGLGCVLAAGPEFGALLTAYFASGLACLALHYRLSVPRLAQQQADGGDSRTEGGWWLLPFTLRWTLLVGALALLLFLLTPRHDGSAWEPVGSFRSSSNRAGSMQVGSGDGINLNGTGTIELDDGIAFQVVATDAEGRPLQNLPGEQRWRGAVLDWYEHGKWTMTRQIQAGPRARSAPQELPDFGPGQFFLTFTIEARRAGGLVLAEPIRLGPPTARLPVLVFEAGGRPSLFVEVAGTVLPLQFSARKEYRYRQVLPASLDSTRTPAPEMRMEGSYLGRMTQQSRPLQQALQEWTVELLRRLAKQPHYPLPDEVRTTLAKPWQSFLIEPEHWESVARALTNYLANSGEFTYTLELTRHDRTIDPVLDFLIHLKRGHCERYATALALMLRSVGVPSRVVKGFRGAENIGDGSFVVRHHHAHAWVEILVPHPDDSAEFDWLTLDPTPGASLEFASRFSLAHWWQNTQQSARQLWQTLILDYNANEQSDLWDILKSDHRLPALVRLGLLTAAVVAGVLGLVLLRRLLRRRAALRPPDTVIFYQRLVGLLGRHTPLQPTSGQTPREFGVAARQFLQAMPGLSALAELPGQVVELFYRVRFGGRPLSEIEVRALEVELLQLAEALVLHRPNGRR